MMVGQILSISRFDCGWLSFQGMNVDLIAPRNSSSPSQRPDSYRLVLSVASEQDREAIYRLRHEVYARELGQHATNPSGKLRDALDDWNIYLVAKIAGQIAGFISLTPPAAHSRGLGGAPVSDPARWWRPGSRRVGDRRSTGAAATTRECTAPPGGAGYSIDKYVARE